MKKLLFCFLFFACGIARGTAQWQIGGAPFNSYVAGASSIRNSNATSSASALTLTASIPSTAVVGDLCLFFFGGQNAESSNSAGWTSLQNSNQSYWNGEIFYKVLTSGDLTSGFSITTGGSASPMILIGVDFVPAVSAYVTSNSAFGTTSPAASTAPTLSSVVAGDVVIYVASYRGDTVPTVSRGALLQSVTTGTGGAEAVYYETLASGFSGAVTYSFPGTFNPQGYYAGYFAAN